MKILVISDTHRYLKNAEDLIEIYKNDISAVIHLGDLVNDAEALINKYSGFNFYYVAGNNDYDKSVNYEDIITIQSKRILITHGHRQRVNYDISNLGAWALQKDADAVLFGHIHRPVREYYGSVLMCNPGSISLPRSTVLPTFGILDIDFENGIDFSVMAYMGNGNVKRLSRF